MQVNFEPNVTAYKKGLAKHIRKSRETLKAAGKALDALEKELEDTSSITLKAGGKPTSKKSGETKDTPEKKTDSKVSGKKTLAGAGGEDEAYNSDKDIEPV